ncbi:MAG: hypothetical protein RSC28_03125 [Bacteroidales bacterium]
MIRKLLIIICAITVCSCSFFESFFRGEKVVQIGNIILYKSDVEKIVPKGISGKDSIALVKQYIDSWSTKQLMLLKAEEQLPKADKDVAEELEDYRTQLLVFRYENKYVEEKLDTLISEHEMQEYYNEHPDSFKSKNGIVKARLIKMHNSSPNLQIVRKLSGKKNVGNMEELEELAYNSAYKYSTYNNSWVDLQIVAREMGEDVYRVRELLEKDDIVEVKDSVYTSILQVVEYIRPNNVAPLEYNTERIREIILSRRKQELLASLQKEILNDALDNKKIKIIKKDEKATD